MNVPEYMRLNKRGCDVCVLQERMWFVFLVFLALCGLWRIDKLGLWADALHGSTRLTFFKFFIMHCC